LVKLKNKGLLYKLSLFVFVFVSINLICAGSVFAATQNATNTSNIIPQTNLTQMNNNITTNTQNTTTNTLNTSNVTDQKNSTFPIKGYYINPTDTPVTTINPTTLKDQGITDIFVLTTRKNPNDTLEPFIAKFAGTGIGVYAWVEAFKDYNGNWFSPASTSTLEKQIIKDITYIATNYNVNGVMLDYLRYPGTAYKYPTATANVDYFASQIRNNINIINNENIAGKHKILLSSTLMPEGPVNDYYYGQNYTQLSNYLDFLSPMIYVGNYNEPTSWIGTTTQYIISQANGKPVVAILQTYASDANPTPISISQLDLDIYTALNSNSNGYELFRYGLMPANFTGYQSTPIVTTITPLKNAVNVPANQVIKITFTEPIKTGSMWIVLQNSVGVSIPITTSISSNILTINHKALLTNGKYILTLHTGSITGLAGNPLALWGSNFNVYSTPPTAKSSVNGGLYNVNKIVYLTMTEPGTIYYTLNGSTPTLTSVRYSTSITISSTETLKYLAIDLAGNKSPVYTQIYTIDKIAPKVSVTSPLNNTTGASLTAPITIKFSENITVGINYSKIYIKNLTTGVIVGITKTISGNTLTIQMTSSRLRLDTYQVYIPAGAIKDTAGNNLATTYTFKFKTI
jgi:methionine-rich copper-binding protein CopC